MRSLEVVHVFPCARLPEIKTLYNVARDETLHVLIRIAGRVKGWILLKKRQTFRRDAYSGTNLAKEGGRSWAMLKARDAKVRWEAIKVVEKRERKKHIGVCEKRKLK